MWTENLTGCWSIITRSTKSGGWVSALAARLADTAPPAEPACTGGAGNPSWWEWIRVSSRSSTRNFRLTTSKRNLNLQLTLQSITNYSISRLFFIPPTPPTSQEYKFYGATRGSPFKVKQEDQLCGEKNESISNISDRDRGSQFSTVYPAVRPFQPKRHFLKETLDSLTNETDNYYK